MPTTTVSICIPTYNGRTYLDDCLASARAQTWRDLEILVVDDGSTDDSVAIVQRHMADDARIRLVRNERNLGLVGNWNRTIEHATGEWIKFLFQDDLLAPDCVSELMAVTAPEVDLVACDRTFIMEGRLDALILENRAAIRRLFASGPLSADAYCDVVIDRYADNYLGEPTATLIRKSAFDRFGFFDDRFVQICDYEFWHRLATNRGVVFVDKPLAQFRVHDASTTARNRDERGFVSSGLDPLLLIHKMQADPAYAHLRERWRTTRGSEAMTRQFTRRCLTVHHFAHVDSKALAHHATIRRLHADFLSTYPDCRPTFADLALWRLRMAWWWIRGASARGAS